MSFTSFTFLFIFFPLVVMGYLLIWFIQRKLNQGNMAMKLRWRRKSAKVTALL